MKLPWRHPSGRDLTRFVDGGCGERRAAEIRSHLEGCSRCRAEIRFLHTLVERAGELRAPLPPPGLLEEILARRAAGERVLLPNSGPTRARTRRSWVLAPVGVAAGLLVTLTIIFPSPQARAGGSELTFDPPAIVPGEELQVVYRPGALLAGKERLTLRGRVRRVGEPPPHGVIGAEIKVELVRGRGGTYRGSLRLPRRAAYAAFAVEALDASRVDSRGHRLWELLARGPDGVPTFDALEQQYRVREARRSAAAGEVARRMTELYPDRARGWFYRLVSDKRDAGGMVADSLRSFHRLEFARLERRAASADGVTPDEFAALEGCARLLDEPDAQARWATRLAAVAPLHPVATRDRVLEALAAHASDPAALLAALEQEWIRTGPLSEFTASQGFIAALQAGDRSAALRWADRLSDMRPDEEGTIGARLTALPATRADGLARLRLHLRRLLTRGEPRPLGRSASEQRSALAGRLRDTRVAIGEALLAAGQPRAAAEVLKIAAADATRPGPFRDLAAAHLALGDTAAALSALAFVAADPLEAAGSADALAGRLGLSSSAVAWRAQVDAARRELDRRLLEDSTLVAIRGDVTVRDADGATHRLRDLQAGRPALVVLWYGHAGLEENEFARLQEGTLRLTRAGAAVVAISLDPEGRHPGGFSTDSRLPFPVFRDGDPGIASALNNWSVPRYLVFDRSGRLRSDGEQLDDALRRVLALLEPLRRVS